MSSAPQRFRSKTRAWLTQPLLQDLGWNGASRLLVRFAYLVLTFFWEQIQRTYQAALRRAMANQFLRNLGWLGATELVIRVIRLGTTFFLARLLTPHDYGLAAIVMTTHDIAQVFTRFGLGEKLIQVEDDRIDVMARSVYWLNWLVYFSLFLIQCGASFGVAWIYDDQRLVLPICLMASSYLVIPLAYVQATLLRRENRLQVQAITNTLQVSVDNILTAIFAYFGLGLWAIVLPKVLVAPIWVVMNWVHHPWRPKGKITIQYWQDLVGFGWNVLGVRVLEVLRNNLDYLLVGKLVGKEALGIYYFAFNAGLGISMSLVSSFSSALYPHLCAARDDWPQFRRRYFKSLTTIALTIIPIVLLQSSLAPIYVPLVFGQKWIAAIPVLMMICLSAIPRPFANATSDLLLAMDKPKIDLIWNVTFSCIFTISLLVGVQWQLLGVAAAVLISHWVCMPLYAFWASRWVLKSAR